MINYTQVWVCMIVLYILCIYSKTIYEDCFVYDDSRFTGTPPLSLGDPGYSANPMIMRYSIMASQLVMIMPLPT